MDPLVNSTKRELTPGWWAQDFRAAAEAAPPDRQWTDCLRAGVTEKGLGPKLLLLYNGVKNKSPQTEYLWCSTLSLLRILFLCQSTVAWISDSEFPKCVYIDEGNFFCPSLWAEKKYSKWEKKLTRFKAGLELVIEFRHRFSYWNSPVCTAN